MFDKLEDLLRRFEDITRELNEPSVTADQERFRKLMKEQSDLTPLVECYTEYKKCKETIDESVSMLEEESDAEMRDLLKQELSDAKNQVPELEQQLKVLLLPRDPNDEKNVIVEIRAGVGGDEAALFAADLYRMYVMYSERQGWHVETMNVVRPAPAHRHRRPACARRRARPGAAPASRIPACPSCGAPASAAWQ